MFIEHKGLYKKKCEVPEEPYECGYNCDIKREGSDITIVAYSSMVDQSLRAAKELEKEGIQAEVIDVRSLEPFDADTIISSVSKTGHAVIAHEACVKGGFGAEIAAVIQEKAFDKLKEPVKRVGAPNVPVPFAPVLEKAYLPDYKDILDAAHSCL